MAGKLVVERSVRLNLDEVSGIAIDARAGGPVRLLAVGDASFAVLTVDIDGDGATSAEQRHKLRKLLGEPKGDGSQWEAIACDAEGNILLLRERPGTVHVFDAALGELRATIALRPPDGAGKKSGGEGLLLLDGGHLLVVHEENPVLLVEYGPEGEAPLGVSPASLPSGALRVTGDVEYVPLQVWPLDDASIEDLSDIARAPDGGVYLISDESRALLRLRLPLAAEDAHAEIEARWDLPDRMANAEGLAFLADGRPLVAVDTEEDEANLFVLRWS
ncbi:MAG: esterase-like activity of phytase family protein [Polyangiaceae bacterium]